jgi:type II secretory ATPase GspE/PulE/Tfp pilus assembly ATPase PilB-like protein
VSDLPSIEENYFLTALRKLGLFYEEDISSMKIDADILALVPKNVAAQYHMIPIFMDQDQLVVVTDEASFVMNKEPIEETIHNKVRPLLATEENVRSALFKHYEITGHAHILSGDNMDSGVDDTPLTSMVKEMIQDAAREHASDIHLLPFSEGIYVHFRINGHLVDYTNTYEFKAAEASNIVNIIKQMDTSATADPSRINLPDSGSWKMVHGDVPIFVRLATVPVGNENALQKVNLRLLPQDSKIIRLHDLYLGEDLKTIRNTLYKSATGMFLNSGPTGSGKTTSLYAQIYDVLDMAGEPLNIMTIDDPIEIREERFTQVQVRNTQSESSDLSNAKIIKIGLRLDPDIFLYNEIRDKQDANVAIEASTTGHRLFSTVHASNCLKTITRLLDMDISKVSLLSELRMIISQRLVAVLCPHCSQSHILTEQERSILTNEEIAALEKADIKEKGSLEAQKACTHCRHGISGRVAVAEYVVFDMDLRDALMGQKGFREIYTILQEHHFKSMWEKGFDMVKSGRVELNEIVRVIGKED